MKKILVSIFFLLGIFSFSQNKTEEFIKLLEEEKMAFLLYSHFHDLYKSRPFEMISASEARHFDAIKFLFDPKNTSYQIPLEEDRFQNNEISELYQKLKKQGEISENDAMKVGKLVEETDIESLQSAIKNADESSKGVFEFLVEASQRHLNAFNKHIQ